MMLFVMSDLNDQMQFKQGKLYYFFRLLGLLTTQAEWWKQNITEQLK